MSYSQTWTLGSVLILMAIAGLEARAEDALEAVKFKYQVEREALLKPLEALRGKYRERLLSLADIYSKAGDLANAVAAKEASEAGDPDPEEVDKSPAQIAGAQRIFLREKKKCLSQEQIGLAPLQQAYLARLAKMQDELTRAGKLEEALLVGEESKLIVAERRRTARQIQLVRTREVSGYFYTSVDDKANFFINGRKDYVAKRGTSKSGLIKLEVGDSIVFSLHNYTHGKRFRTAFQSKDKAYSISFKASDLKVIDDSSDKRIVTQEEWDKLPAYAQNTEETETGDIPFDHESEWVWERGDRAILAVIITMDMIKISGE